MSGAGKYKMKSLVIFVHGKGGNAAEAEHYKPFFPDSEVFGFDYKAENPWEAEAGFSDCFDKITKGVGSVVLIANSLGAYFSMCALSGKQISKALFISPVVNMEKMISDMMMRAKVTEETLKLKKEIHTEFGETLSWDYLCYVRAHPVKWSVPTSVLYGGKDNLTSIETVEEFAAQTGAALTVMEEGEHWFHTDEQMRFLDMWLEEAMR